MARFVLVPDGTFTDPSPFEDIELVPVEFPTSRYLDFDPADLSTITKDGSNNVSNWKNVLGAQALNTPAVAANFPLWTPADINGLPSMDLNNGGTKNLYSSADILHNLTAGYSFAMVFNLPVTGSFALWSTSTASSGFTSVFYNTGNVTWRQNGAESLLYGAFAANTWKIFIGTYNPTGRVCKLWDNHTLINTLTSAGDPTSARKLLLGWNTVLVSRVKVARFIEFNATLSETEVAVVREILGDTYGIA